MADPLDEYKTLIDALVAIRPCVLVYWVKVKGWPNLPENKAANELLASLSSAQKEAIANMLQQARDGGIHDVLAYLNDEINLQGLRLVRHGSELPVEPFGTEMYWDWTCRCGGDAWPG